MSRKWFMTLAMLVCLGGRLLLAQGSFNSGSNNSDGALDLTGQEGTSGFIRTITLATSTPRASSTGLPLPYPPESR